MTEQRATAVDARAAELIVEGRIASLGGETGFGWVEAIAIRQGRVLAAGRPSEVAAFAGSATRWLRLAPGEVAMPGITDAHLHLQGAALARLALDLHDTTSLEEGMRLVHAEHQRRLDGGDQGSWILGAGWSVDRWGKWPSAQDLGAAAPGRAVALKSHDHHSRVVSLAAMRQAGWDRFAAGAADPTGGKVGHDEHGSPTGVLHETATTLVDHAIPRPPAETIEAAVAGYAGELLALGVTGVHDPGEIDAYPDVRDGPMLYERMARRHTLPLRVHGSIRAHQLDGAIRLGLRSGLGVAPADRDRVDDLQVDRFRMGWLKLFADGAMGSRTAALLEPYEPDASMPPPAGGPAGMLVTPPEELARLTAAASEAGIATQIHAIGDLAVRVALVALETAGRPELPLMPRVEHVQLLAPDDAPRFASAGIAASIQPVHLHSDAAGARRLWGARTAGAYVVRTLLDAGAVVAFGTDAPVESPDPWPGIALAVTRSDPTWGPEAGGPFHAEQAVSLAEAVRAACVGPGASAGDDRVGRLVPGSPADLLILDAAVLGEPVAVDGPLRSARPLATLVDGAVVHRSAGWDREPVGRLR